jgi:hypothetical protein
MAIGFAAGLVGGKFGDFLGQIVFPMGKPENASSSSSLPEFDAEWVHTLEEAGGTVGTHPQGYFPAGMSSNPDSLPEIHSLPLYLQDSVSVAMRDRHRLPISTPTFLELHPSLTWLTVTNAFANTSKGNQLLDAGAELLLCICCLLAFWRTRDQLQRLLTNVTMGASLLVRPSLPLPFLS